MKFSSHFDVLHRSPRLARSPHLRLNLHDLTIQAPCNVFSPNLCELFNVCRSDKVRFLICSERQINLLSGVTVNVIWGVDQKVANVPEALLPSCPFPVVLKSYDGRPLTLIGSCLTIGLPEEHQSSEAGISRAEPVSLQRPTIIKKSS